MASRIQTRRFLSTGQRPATGENQIGTLYTNIPDKMLGVVDDAESPADLIAVRFFSVSSVYAVGAHVLHNGSIRRCITATGPGTFVEAHWGAGEQPVVLSATYRDLNNDAWGGLGGGIYTVSGQDFEWANVPWNMEPELTYTVYATVTRTAFHAVQILVSSSSPSPDDNSMWTRTGVDWAQAKTKAWGKVGAGANLIVSTTILDPTDYKVGQQWYSESTARLGTKIEDEAGNEWWVELGRPSIVNTNVLVPLRPPIYADGPLNPALYPEGQWWMDTLNNIAKNRYVDLGGDPQWVEFFTFTQPA